MVCRGEGRQLQRFFVAELAKSFGLLALRSSYYSCCLGPRERVWLGRLQFAALFEVLPQKLPHERLASAGNSTSGLRIEQIAQFE